MKDVCIVFAGTKFTDKHIVQKRQQLDRYCSVPTRLTVLTDDPARIMGIGLRDTRAVLLPDDWRFTGRLCWWYKVFMFSNTINWYGDVLYLDLDTILVNDIAHLWTYEPGKFVICQDFNRKFIRDYPVSNSSVIRFPVNEYTAICEHFNSNWQQISQQFRGDQDYITHWFKSHTGKTWWPTNWCMSYKWEILHGGTKHGSPRITYPQDYLQPDVEWVIPDDCSIVVFHGAPDPYETHFGKRHTL
jgi:hypothetical protein